MSPINEICNCSRIAFISKTFGDFYVRLEYDSLQEVEKRVDFSLCVCVVHAHWEFTRQASNSYNSSCFSLLNARIISMSQCLKLNSTIVFISFSVYITQSFNPF